MALTTYTASNDTIPDLIDDLNTQLSTVLSRTLCGAGFLGVDKPRTTGIELSIYAVFNSTGTASTNPFQVAAFEGLTINDANTLAAAFIAANPGYFFAPTYFVKLDTTRRVRRDIAILFYNVDLTDGTNNWVPWGATNGIGSGTVTSVGLMMPSIFSVSGSPVTTAGNLTATLVVQTANTVFAGPTGGAPATPTFRALVAADIPNLDASKITTGLLATARGGTGVDGSAAANGTLLIGNGTGYTLATITAGSGISITNGAGSITIDATGGGGTVTSVALALPVSVFSISGSPVTTTGTLTGAFVTQAANTVFAGPTLGAAATPAFRALVAADIPNLDASKITTGLLAVARGGTGVDGSAAANGTLLIGNGTGYTLATLTGTAARLSVTNGAGSITLDISATYVGQTSITTLGTITTGTWNATLIAAQYGGTGINGATAANGTLLIGNGTGYTLATLTAVSARTTITNGAGSITIDISATYVGQTSITTLGTITTGTWNGSVIGVAYGGTGVDASAAANGQIPIGNGTGFTLATITGTAGRLSVTNGAGSITLNIDTGYIGQNTITTLGTVTTGTWNATVIGAQYGGTGVDGSAAANGTLLIGNGTGYTLATLTGTTNRLTVTNGAGSITLDIAATYVGQTSITTLGTITTGTWNATAIGVAYGGTGVDGSAAANGTLLIGNGTGYTLATLTAVAARTTITNGAGSITIDIAATYVGQTSITTLGTVTTGTWNATVIAAQYGGTGVNGATAANGTLLIGNGTGYTLATLTAVSARTTITNGAGSITIDIAATYVGQTSITTLGTITTGTWNATAIGAQYGGTGINGSAAANGTLLIGNGAGYTLATLTAGTNIAITNGSGTITIGFATTLSGTMTLAENASFGLNTALTADGKYTGTNTVAGTAGAALAFGNYVVFDTATSRWRLGDISVAAGATGDVRGMTGICVLAAAANGDPTVILLGKGTVRADAAFPTFAVNAQVWASTAGAVTTTQPTTTDYVIRALGVAITADSIYFDPSALWFTHV